MNTEGYKAHTSEKKADLETAMRRITFSIKSDKVVFSIDGVTYTVSPGDSKSKPVENGTNELIITRDSQWNPGHWDITKDSANLGALKTGYAFRYSLTTVGSHMESGAPAPVSGIKMGN